MLRRNWFHVLVALASKDLHGSAIAEDVLAQTDGKLRLWPATLYRALDELVEEGLVEELRGGDRPDGESLRKRYYRVTAEGRRAVAEEARRMERMAQEAQARIGEPA